MPLRKGFALLLAALALTACGSSGGGGSAAPTPTGRSTPDEATKDGQEIIEDSAVVMVHVTSWRIEGSFASPTYTGTFVEERSGADYHEVMKVAQGTAESLYVRGQLFLKMSASLLSAASGGGAVSAQLADRWLHLTQDRGQFYDLHAELEGHGLADCVEGAISGDRLTTAGTEEVRGQKAIVLKSTGSRPGTAAGRIDIAYHGLRPLRYTLLGPVDKSGLDCAGSLFPEVHTLTAASEDYVSYAGVTLTSPIGAVDVDA